MKQEPYVDSWIIYFGIIVLTVVGLIAGVAAISGYFIHQVDNRIEECPTTKTSIRVKDCKGTTGVPSKHA